MLSLNDVLKLEIRGLRDSLNLGLSEASFLGAEFLGLTLDNGVGLVMRVTPSEEIREVLLVSRSELPGELFGVFVRHDGEKLLIYKIDRIEELKRLLGGERRVVYVEVIRGELEDFLLEALDR